jgi:HEAT repeat protein
VTPDDSQLGLSTSDRVRMDEVQRLALEGASSVESLIALLADPSWVVRRAVVAALARAAGVAVRPLCDVLTSDRTNEARLAAAVDALVASAAHVEPALLALAERNPQPPVLCDVAQVCGRRKSRASVPALAAWTKHADDNVAVAAIEALGRIGGPTVLEPLLAAASTGNFFRTFPAIAFLGESGDPRAVDMLAVLTLQPYYVNEAATALGRSGHAAALAPLAKLLDHDNEGVVRAAASALVDLRHRHAERFGNADALVAELRADVSTRASRRAAQALVRASAPEKVSLACVLGWLHDEHAIATLVAMLDDEPAIAASAFDALRTLGPEATEPIRRAIRDGSSEVRARVLPLLGARRVPATELVACLRDADANVRALASEALARMGDASVVGALFAIIGDADPRVAQAASSAIQSLGSDEAKTHALAAATSTDARTRRAALRIISYFGYAEALDVLLAAIHDEDERIRDAAMTGLALVDDPRTIPAILTALDHASPGTRAAAARSLSNAASTLEVRAGLLGALSDADAWVRYYACQSLGKLHAVEATNDIARRLVDPAGQVRVAAIEAIARLGGQRALDVLTEASRKPDPDVRRAALLGLSQLQRPEAFSVLVEASESDDAGNRLVALSAIAEMRTPEADGALIRAGSDPDENVRAAALELLATRGPVVTRWIIERIAVEADREALLAALGHPAEGRIEVILAALATADATLAALLVGALLRMRRPSGNAAVEGALHLDNVNARRAAAAGLARLGTPSARAALDLAASADEDTDVRRIAAEGT